MRLRFYVIGVVVVIILFLGSVIYKQQNTMFYYHFPVPENLKKKAAEGPPFYLFLFFSKKDCMSCLVEMIEVINTLPSQFSVAGIVPVEELKDEPGLRRLSGASFPLYNRQKFKKYLPGYTPTLFGVSPSGKIIFVLPAFQGQKAYLRNILVSVYGKLYPSLKREHFPVEGG